LKYQRLVEIYVKPDLRDKIKILKGGKTSDEFLRYLIEKREFGPMQEAKPESHGEKHPSKRRMKNP